MKKNYLINSFNKNYLVNSLIKIIDIKNYLNYLKDI